jgi:hypothetical protein
MRIRNVSMLCAQVKRPAGKESSMHVGPTVFIHFKNTTTHKLQYFPFLENNEMKQTVIQSNKAIHGTERDNY